MAASKEKDVVRLVSELPGGRWLVQVFLSYASADRAVAERYRSEFERVGIDAVPWDRVLTPGTYWASQIGQAVESADAFVVLISNSAVKSEWVQFEIAAAIAAEAKSDVKRIIPIILDPDIRLPALLAPYLAIDASKRDEVDSVVGAIKRVLTKAPARADKAREREAAHRQLDSLRTTLEDERFRYEAVTESKRYRAVIATTLIVLLGSILGVGILGVAFAVSTEGVSVPLLSSLLGAVVGLVGAAVGFYFGSRSRER